MKTTFAATALEAADSEVADNLTPAFTILYHDYRMEFMAAFSTFWKKHWGDFCGIDTVSLESEQLVGLGPLHTPLDPTGADDTYNTVDNQTAIHVIQVFSQIYLLHKDEFLLVTVLRLEQIDFDQNVARGPVVAWAHTKDIRS